jgi:transposase InsO family protein
MSEHNDKSEQEAGDGQDVKRWTAKRRAALVVEILSGKTTIQDGVNLYNDKQPHQALGYLSPIQFRAEQSSQRVA